MCGKWEESLKLLQHLVTYSKYQLKIMQCSYGHLKCLPDIYSMSTYKQASFTVTPPRHDEAQDWRGICRGEDRLDDVTRRGRSNRSN